MVNRRDFLKASMMATAGVVVSSGITACTTKPEGGSTGAGHTFKTGPLKIEDRGFLHGVKSGDPLRDKLIIWTRITPLDTQGNEKEFYTTDKPHSEPDANKFPEPLPVIFEVATDDKFQNIVNRGETYAKAASDFTVKVDVQNLHPETRYYYRFISGGAYSQIGTAKTLPPYYSSPNQVKFVVFSCANYPNGYFNAYDAASKVKDVDVALHLGDYIYEYGSYKDDDFVKKVPGYANKNAVKMGRVLPENNNMECVKLVDYRRRYKIYATDAGSQALHAKVPMIVIWDDHEVCNDTYKEGAENHNPDKGEGNYDERVRQALQAYYEWLPIRPLDPNVNYGEPPYPEDPRKIYREFSFGNLVSLYMLETRLTARTEAESTASMLVAAASDLGILGFRNTLNDSNKKLIGDDQKKWLTDRVKRSQAKWQVLGQQVVMGRMVLPIHLLYLLPKLKVNITELQTYIADITASVYDDNYKIKPATEELFKNMLATFEDMVKEKTKIIADPKDTINAPLYFGMQNPLPYNTDAWDGYNHEREEILKLFSEKTDSSLVVLAGDTHNAWANDLYLDNKDKTPVGVEFACSSVSSPGMEEYLGYLGKQGKMPIVENSVQKLCDGLKFCNLTDRGFMEVTFTQEKVTSNWHFLNNTNSTEYGFKTDRNYSIDMNFGERKIPQQPWEKEWQKEIDALKQKKQGS